MKSPKVPNQNSGCPVPSTTLRAGSLRFLQRAGSTLSGTTTVQAARSRNEISPQPLSPRTGPEKRHSPVTRAHDKVQVSASIEALRASHDTCDCIGSIVPAPSTTLRAGSRKKREDGAPKIPFVEGEVKTHERACHPPGLRQSDSLWNAGAALRLMSVNACFQ